MRRRQRVRPCGFRLRADPRAPRAQSDAGIALLLVVISLALVPRRGGGARADGVDGDTHGGRGAGEACGQGSGGGRAGARVAGVGDCGRFE